MSDGRAGPPPRWETPPTAPLTHRPLMSLSFAGRAVLLAVARARSPARRAARADRGRSSRRRSPTSATRSPPIVPRSARARLHVATTFGAASAAPVVLSLPAWTPGAYEIANFARDVSGFGAVQGQRHACGGTRRTTTRWRVWPKGAGQVTVSFDFLADTLDNAMAWTRPDFALFNGTNVFLYPEGRSTDFPSTVTVRTEPDFLIATGMTRAAGAADLHGGELSRARRHALLRRPVRPRQRDRVGEDGALRDVSARERSLRAARAHGVGADQARPSRPRCSSSARCRGTATRHVDHRLDRRRDEWARARQLARRRRASRPAIGSEFQPSTVRARDLPRVEREAAAAGRPRAVPLRPVRSRRPGSG